MKIGRGVLQHPKHPPKFATGNSNRSSHILLPRVEGHALLIVACGKSLRVVHNLEIFYFKQNFENPPNFISSKIIRPTVLYGTTKEFLIFIFLCVFILQKISDMQMENSLGLLKNGAVKKSRIKRIMWHLRWLVCTRADISFRPSGLKPKTDIKLQPSTLVCKNRD